MLLLNLPSSRRHREMGKASWWIARAANSFDCLLAGGDTRETNDSDKRYRSGSSKGREVLRASARRAMRSM